MWCQEYTQTDVWCQLPQYRKPYPVVLMISHAFFADTPERSLGPILVVIAPETIHHMASVRNLSDE